MNSSNFTSKANDDDDDSLHNTSAVTKALRNPLILDHILAQLDISDLKTSRLVCPEWSNISTDLLGKRAFLHVNKLFQYDASSSLVGLAPVNDKLIKRVTFSNNFRPWPFADPTNKMVDVITDALNMLNFTKIRHISIAIPKPDFTTTYGPPATCREMQIPILRNLTSLKFSLDPYMNDETVHIVSPSVVNLLQLVVNAGPNLTTLDITGSLYPNLEECKNLKVLTFIFTNSRRTKLDFTAVPEMLSRVKESLTEAELRCNSCPPVSMREAHFILMRNMSCERLEAPDYFARNLNPSVPIMSKVVSLTIDEIQVYKIHHFFDEEHFPSLKKLKLYNITLLTNLKLYKRHRGVEFLSLSMVHSIIGGNLAATIVQLFPSVKTFDLSTDLSVVEVKDSHAVNQTIKPFRTWVLEKVKVTMNTVGESALLVALLKSVSTWPGVKVAKFNATRVTQEDFSSHVQDLILYSGGFKSVEISGNVEAEILERFQSIFAASSAPIKLTGGVHSHLRSRRSRCMSNVY